MFLFHPNTCNFNKINITCHINPYYQYWLMTSVLQVCWIFRFYCTKWMSSWGYSSSQTFCCHCPYLECCLILFVIKLAYGKLIFYGFLWKIESIYWGASINATIVYCVYLCLHYRMKDKMYSCPLKWIQRRHHSGNSNQSSLERHI